MRSDLETVEYALSLFKKQENEHELSGSWGSFSLRLGYTSQEVFCHGQEVVRQTQYVTYDLWNICTYAHRIEWFRDVAIQNPALAHYWMYYTAVDIQSLVLELRAAVNYASNVIRLYSPSPGSIAEGSFRKLLNWLKKNGDRLHMPEVVELALKQEQWFTELRSVRDMLHHRGAMALVFGSPSDGILFQVLDGMKSRILANGNLMHSENVVHFDRYAALNFAYLLTFLEDLAKEYMHIYPSELPNPDVKSKGFGFKVIVKWMENLRDQLTVQSS